MAPFLTLAVALATLGAATSVPLPSVATAGEHSLRGGRGLQEGLCNSIGCPAGFTPIPDAINVECIGGTCEVSQCCEAFCSFHPCPESFIPVPGAATIICPDSGCTNSLCCVEGFPLPTATDDETTIVFVTDSPTASPFTTDDETTIVFMTNSPTAIPFTTDDETTIEFMTGSPTASLTTTDDATA